MCKYNYKLFNENFDLSTEILSLQQKKDYIETFKVKT